MTVVLDGWIADLEDKRCAAMLSNDADQIAPFLDNDLIYIHSSAVKDTRDEYVAWIRDGVLRYRSSDPDYQQVVHLSDRAFLLYGRIRMDIEWGGKPKKLDNLFIASWRRGQDDEWRLLSWQSTPVPAAAH